MSAIPPSRLLVPFAEKFILPGNNAVRARGWDGSLPYYLDLGRDLRWHLQYNLRNPSFLALIEDLPMLATQLLQHRATSQGKVPQPIWDLRERCVDEPLYDGPIEGLENTGIEYLAWYIPAHNLRGDEYGIHLLKRGIARLTSDIQNLCPDQPVQVLAMASIFLLLAHEVCHAYVEDLCCLMEFSFGTPVSESRYLQAPGRWGSCILMEEALCNTAAWGWLYEFLHADDGKDVPFDCAVVSDAFCRWLHCSPPGYRDFLPIRCAPTASAAFLEGTRRLLEEVYGYDARDLPDVDTLIAHHQPGFTIFSGPHVPLHLNP